MENQDKKNIETGSQEKWTRWVPIEGLAEEYDIETLQEKSYGDGFRVTLFEFGHRIKPSNEHRKVQVLFKRSVDCYTMTDESYINHLLSYLNKQYGGEFYSRWTFFKITNSDYLKRLSVLSSTVSDEANLKHFVLLGVNSMIDIIAQYEPEVTFITDEINDKS